MLDSSGFKRKTYADLLAEGEAKARELFGEDINTSRMSPVGIILRVFAWFLSVLWMVAEKVYLSAFVDTAEGVSLDRLGVQAGVKRIVNTYASGPVELTGTAGYTVTPGLLAQKPSGTQYVITNAVTLDSNGKGITTVQAVNPGSSGNADVGEISVLVNPDANLTAITNLEAIENGADRESDAAFRARFRTSRAARGSATLNSLQAAVAALPGVRAVKVVENEEEVPDSEGRPPNSFETYVLGGEQAAIARAIFDNKAGGIRTWGSITQQVADISGTLRTIRFSRPTTVPIFANLQVETNSSAASNVADQVKDAIVQYIGGEAADGTVYAGGTMGEDVLWAKIIRAAYTVTGVENVHGGIGTTAGSYSTNDIAIQEQQVAQINAAGIEVTVT